MVTLMSMWRINMARRRIYSGYSLKEAADAIAKDTLENWDSLPSVPVNASMEQVVSDKKELELGLRHPKSFVVDGVTRKKAN